MASADILYAAGGEHAATTNARAFLHWLDATRRAALAGWTELQHFSVHQPDAFIAAVAAFAGLPATPLRLARHAGGREALVLRTASGSDRRSFSRDRLATNPTDGLPPELAALLARAHAPAALVPALADLLLFADLRPDDCLLVANLPAWPFLAALLEGTTLILATEISTARLMAVAAEENASFIAAPASSIAESVSGCAGPGAAGPRTGTLRAILAVGGPLPSAVRRLIYTETRHDLMLLACSGETPARRLWGNPLDPVLVKPRAAPGFFQAAA